MPSTSTKGTASTADPNSHAGVACCFGEHDRPWRRRLIFGKVRCMGKRGWRSFNAGEYVDRIWGLNPSNR